MNVDDTSKFFLIYPLNLEDLGKVELQEKIDLFFPNEAFQIEQKEGGLELECSIKNGFLLNHVLRSPTRILLRVAEFKCRDFPKLYQKISKINWSNLLLGIAPGIEASAKNSRVFDSRKIEKAVTDGILEFYRKQPPKKKFLELANNFNRDDLPKIYIRLENDICTVSLDTTGRRLHLRDEKILSGLAPIRENLAYMLLSELEYYIANKDISYTLIDPMCGSGTFLIEAKNKYKVTNGRKYSYQLIPLSINENVDTLTSTDNHKIIFNKIIGFDIDENIVHHANINLGDIKVTKADIFSNNIIEEENVIIISNPPYGIRVGSNIDGKFFERIIEQSQKKFSAKYLGIIIPDEFRLKFPTYTKLLKIRSFSNGGIPVTFYVFEFK